MEDLKIAQEANKMQAEIDDLKIKYTLMDKSLALFSQTMESGFKSLNDKMDALLKGDAVICQKHTRDVELINSRVDKIDAYLETLKLEHQIVKTDLMAIHQREERADGNMTWLWRIFIGTLVIAVVGLGIEFVKMPKQAPNSSTTTTNSTQPFDQLHK